MNAVGKNAGNVPAHPYFFQALVSYFMIIDRNVEAVCFFRLKLTAVVLKEMIDSQVPVIPSR